MLKLLTALVEVAGEAIKDGRKTVRLCVIVIVVTTMICITALVLG